MNLISHNRTHFLKILFFIMTLLTIESCSNQHNRPEITSKSNLSELLKEGIGVMRSGKPQKAIDNYFDPIIESYNEKYKNSDKLIYCSHNIGETLVYMMMAVNKSKSAIAIVPIWSDALFFKAYAYIELKQTLKAKSALEKALKLSPYYPQYLTEMGHIYQIQKKWRKSKIYYKRVVDEPIYGGERNILFYTARGLRGLGYSNIELGNLKTAAIQFLQCLHLNPNDRKALKELFYITVLLKKIKTQPEGKKLASFLQNNFPTDKESKCLKKKKYKISSGIFKTAQNLMLRVISSPHQKKYYLHYISKPGVEKKFYIIFSLGKKNNPRILLKIKPGRNKKSVIVVESCANKRTFRKVYQSLIKGLKKR